MRYFIDDLLECTENLFCINKYSKILPYFHYFFIVDSILDEIYFVRTIKGFHQLIPIIITLLRLFEVFLLHSRLENLDKFINQYQKLLWSVLSRPDIKFVSERLLSILILFASPIIESNFLIF